MELLRGAIRTEKLIDILTLRCTYGMSREYHTQKKWYRFCCDDALLVGKRPGDGIPRRSSS